MWKHRVCIYVCVCVCVQIKVLHFKYRHVVLNNHEWFSVQPKRSGGKPPFTPVDCVLWAEDEKENES